MSGARKIKPAAAVRFVSEYEGAWGSIFRRAMADHFGVDPRTIERELPWLVEKDLLVAETLPGKGAPKAYRVSVGQDEFRTGAAHFTPRKSNGQKSYAYRSAEAIALAERDPDRPAASRRFAGHGDDADVRRWARERLVHDLQNARRIINPHSRVREAAKLAKQLGQGFEDELVLLREQLAA